MYRNLAGTTWMPVETVLLKFFDKEVHCVTFVNNTMVLRFDDGEWTYPIHCQEQFVFWKIELIEFPDELDAG